MTDDHTDTDTHDSTDFGPMQVDCVDCDGLQDYSREQSNVVRCDRCGKRHSDASLKVAVNRGLTDD